MTVSLRWLTAAAALLICCSIALGDDPPAEPGITLLGMLEEWIYPDAKFHGASSPSAPIEDISAIKSQATLTTRDPVEQVMAFYRHHLHVDAEGRNLDEEPGEGVTTDRAVLIHDQSADRDLELFIIHVNEAGSSTVVVVSRAANETLTHIAWTNHRQLWP